MAERAVYVFPESGASVEITPAPDDLFFDIEGSVPKPQMIQTTVPSPDGERWVDDPDNPKYEQEMNLWTLEVGKLYEKTLLNISVFENLTLTPEQLEQVAERRAYFTKMGVKLVDDDKMVWLFKVAAGGKQSAVNKLVTVIQKLNQPTEKEIKEDQRQFRRRS